MKKDHYSLIFIFIGGFLFCIGLYFLTNYLKAKTIEDLDLQELKKSKEKFDRQQALKTKYKLETHIRFLYGLHIKDAKPTDNFDVGYDYIVPFSNPYEKTFNDLEFSNTTTRTTNTFIENKTEADLIVFKLINGIDESIYIPKDESTYLNLKQKDTVVFYYGEYFKNTYFSHFKERTGISALYEIDQLNNNDEPNYITVNSFKSVNKDSKKSKNQSSYKTIEFNNIKTTELPHINDLYSDYYKKHYRK
jgi:hypothetical protein